MIPRAMIFAFGLLSLGPRIDKVNETLVVTSGWKTLVLTLGLVWRRVTVDPDKEIATIESRYFWTVERLREVTFREIRAVTYGYSDQSLSQHHSYTHQALDVYRVGLRLIHDEEIHLFRFVGEGAWMSNSPFPDWMHWEERLVDFFGTQDRDSLGLVELLSGLIGVRVRPPK